jgi:hypothetical protein
MLYPAPKIVQKNNSVLNESNNKANKVQTISPESFYHFDQRMNCGTVYIWKLFQIIFNLLMRPLMFCLNEN